jgi:hypothetical protein
MIFSLSVGSASASAGSRRDRMRGGLIIHRGLTILVLLTD